MEQSKRVCVCVCVCVFIRWCYIGLTPLVMVVVFNYKAYIVSVKMSKNIKKKNPF